MENNFDKDFQWVQKVVNSSINHQQLDCSRNCFTNLLHKYKSHLDSHPSVFKDVSEEFNQVYYHKFLDLG